MPHPLRPRIPQGEPYHQSGCQATAPASISRGRLARGSGYVQPAADWLPVTPRDWLHPAQAASQQGEYGFRAGYQSAVGRPDLASSATRPIPTPVAAQAAPARSRETRRNPRSDGCGAAQATSQLQGTVSGRQRPSRLSIGCAQAAPGILNGNTPDSPAGVTTAPCRATPVPLAGCPRDTEASDKIYLHVKTASGRAPTPPRNRNA